MNTCFRFVAIVAAAWLALSAATPVEAASDRLVQQKIGYVDLMEIQLKAEPVKRLMDEAQKKLKPKMEEAQQNMARQDELQRQAKNPSILSDEKKDQLRKEMDKLTERLNDLNFQINRQMSQEVDKTTAEATAMIIRAVRTVAESQGYSLVLTTESLVYAAPSTNLTPVVINYLNGAKAQPAAEKKKD